MGHPFLNPRQTSSLEIVQLYQQILGSKGEGKKLGAGGEEGQKSQVQ